MYYTYILRCKDGSLYTGSAVDLHKREYAHNTGKGSAYVRSRGGGTIVYSERHPTWSQALQREAAIKRMSKRDKEQLIVKDI